MLRGTGFKGIKVQLERDGALRDALVDGAVSNGVACVEDARWSDDGSEVDYTAAEETFLESELERAAAASIARDAMSRSELVPAYRRCA